MAGRPAAGCRRRRGSAPRHASLRLPLLPCGPARPAAPRASPVADPEPPRHRVPHGPAPGRRRPGPRARWRPGGPARAWRHDRRTARERATRPARVRQPGSASLMKGLVPANPLARATGRTRPRAAGLCGVFPGSLGPRNGADGRSGGCGRTALAAYTVSCSVTLTASVCRNRTPRHPMSLMPVPLSAGIKMNHYCTRRRFLQLRYRHVAVRCLACPFHDGLLALLPDRRDPDACRGLPRPVQAGLDRHRRGYLHRRCVRLAHCPAAQPRLSPGLHPGSERLGGRGRPRESGLDRRGRRRRAAPSWTREGHRRPGPAQGPGRRSGLPPRAHQAIRGNPPVS